MERMPVFSPEIKKSQEKYEKGVKNIISEPLFERVINFLKTENFDSLKREKKGLTKEDVIRIDANLELEARKAAEGKDAESPEQIYLSRLLNSDVYLKETDERLELENYGFYGYSPEHEDFLVGEINEDKVNILNRYTMDGETGKTKKIKVEDKIIELNHYFGDINGKEIPNDEAKKIFENYGPIGKNRAHTIKDFLKNEQESKIKENAKPAADFK